MLSIYDFQNIRYDCEVSSLTPNSQTDPSGVHRAALSGEVVSEGEGGLQHKQCAVHFLVRVVVESRRPNESERTED